MNFLDGAIPIGRVVGITIRIHVLFILFVAFRLFDAARTGDVRTELLFIALLFGLVLLHEIGHCLGARAVGGHAEDILMWPLGGLAYAAAPMRPWPQFVTVAAGPAVNLLLCVLSAGLILGVTHGNLWPPLNPLTGKWTVSGPHVPPEWLTYAMVFYHVNLWLLAFNLLPIFPLDGGQLFQALLWPFIGLRRAAVLACQVGLVGAALFAYLALRGEGSMLLFIAIFGGLTCWQRLQAARQGMLYEDPAYTRSSADGRPFWQRLLGSGRRRRPERMPTGQINPNPGGWEARQAERAAEEAELDRILKKVSEHGIHSLSYIERQTLERITRERQAAGDPRKL